MPNRICDALSSSTQWGAPEDQVLGCIGRLIEEGLLTESQEDPCPCSESFEGAWVEPLVEKHKEPLHKVMVSAFDPSLPLAE
jgi:hypothetical protein